ncbi:hypothetical protein BDZ97DRAFT_1668818, partial [Flammula alnicola]
STPILVVDSKGRVAAAFVGRPNDPSFVASSEAVYDAMEEEGETAGFQPKTAPHRRGHFTAVNVGVTHGQGTDHPVYLDNHQHTAMMGRLVSNPHVKRLAAFASASLAAFVPGVYDYYKDHLDRLFEHMPSLPRLFPPNVSVYPSAAFNFPPNVWTYKHRDVLNCPFGFCAIQALGRFDPKKGGHIILWELGLIVEFPSGSLVLIPSATITHSNTPVANGDTRASFTQYAAGGLFRYVDYGFRKEKDLKRQDPALYEEISRQRPNRWKFGVDLLTKIEDLRKSFS